MRLFVKEMETIGGGGGTLLKTTGVGWAKSNTCWYWVVNFVSLILRIVFFLLLAKKRKQNGMGLVGTNRDGTCVELSCHVLYTIKKDEESDRWSGRRGVKRLKCCMLVLRAARSAMTNSRRFRKRFLFAPLDDVAQNWR